MSGLVVFLVALPLCLGIALASDAPLFSGMLAGIVGGVVVGLLSGSHTSVSGPAAGLTAVVAAQIAALGSFEAFLLAVIVAGVIQFSGWRAPVHRGLLSLQRDQGPAGRDRRDSDPEADSAPVRPRHRSGRGDGVPAAGPREHLLGILRDCSATSTRGGGHRPGVARPAGRSGTRSGR